MIIIAILIALVWMAYHHGRWTVLQERIAELETEARRRGIDTGES